MAHFAGCYVSPLDGAFTGRCVSSLGDALTRRFAVSGLFQVKVMRFSAYYVPPLGDALARRFDGPGLFHV